MNSVLSVVASLPMEKGVPSGLFVNDGSFMERFKQLQQQKDDKDKVAALEESRPPKIVKGSSAPKPSIALSKIAMEYKPNDARKTTQTPSGGKLAFSLKQKSKLVAPPVKLSADEDEEDQDAGKLSDDTPVKRQKLGQSDAAERASKQVDVGNYCFYLSDCVAVDDLVVLKDFTCLGCMSDTFPTSTGF